MTRALLSACAFALLSSVAFFAHAAPAPQPAGVPTAAVTASVNLNSADAETLAQRLQGIGLAKARAIVEHREAHGPFQAVDELLEVKGIGVSTLEKNREIITLE